MRVGVVAAERDPRDRRGWPPGTDPLREQLGLARSGRGRDERERALHAPVEEVHKATADDRALRQGRHDPPGGQCGRELFESRRRRVPSGVSPQGSQSGHSLRHNARRPPGVSVSRSGVPPAESSTTTVSGSALSMRRDVSRRRCPASPPPRARVPDAVVPQPRSPPRRTRPQRARRSRAWPTPPRAPRGGRAREDPRRSLRPGHGRRIATRRALGRRSIPLVGSEIVGP